MTNFSDNIIDLVTCRVKLCPIDPNYQQILTYSRIRNKTHQIDNLNKIQYIFSHGIKNAILELHNRVKRVKRDDKEIYDTFSFPCDKTHLFIWRKYDHQKGPLFTQNCAEHSFCHIAQKYRQHPNIQIQRNKNNQAGCEATTEEELNQYFAMHICIKNKPGTIYALTCALSKSENEVFNKEKEFDFNLDHLRSTLCRAENCVKINLYGHYLLKAKKMCYEQAIRNVKAITLYHLRQNRDIKQAIEDIFKERLHLHERRVGPNDIKAFCSYNLYNRRVGDRIDCPIARFAPCPGSTSNSSAPTNGDILKIMACICDEPGSLRELAELIAIKKII